MIVLGLTRYGSTSLFFSALAYSDYVNGYASFPLFHLVFLDDSNVSVMMLREPLYKLIILLALAFIASSLRLNDDNKLFKTDLAIAQPLSFDSFHRY